MANNDPKDFAKTELGAPVFDLDELAAAAGKPVGPKEREVHGPAWAGTLTGLDASPSIASSPEATPPSAPIPTPAAERAHSDEDLAATSLHRRAYPLAPDEPIRELPEPGAPSSG